MASGARRSLESTESAVPEGKNVIRIRQSGKMKLYIDYAEKQLLDPQVASVYLVAIGRTIAKAVSVAEILKRLHPVLKQSNTLQPAPSTNVNHTSSRLSSCLVIQLENPDSHQDVEMNTST